MSGAIHVQHHADYDLDHTHHRIPHSHRQSRQSIHVFLVTLHQCNHLVRGQHVEAAAKKTPTQSAQDEINYDGNFEGIEDGEYDSDYQAAVKQRIELEVLEDI